MSVRGRSTSGENLLKARLGICALSLLPATLFPSVASADHLPMDWCSPSGRLCLDTHEAQGERKLRIGLRERHFRHYHLCVTAPDDTKVCKRSDIKPVNRLGNGEWGDSIIWSRKFPNKGPGEYKVRWKHDHRTLGPPLGFHVYAD
jgi:hypothetical protein